MTLAREHTLVGTCDSYAALVNECNKYDIAAPDVLALILRAEDPTRVSKENGKWFVRRVHWLDSRCKRLQRKIEDVSKVPAVRRYVAMRELHDDSYRELVVIHGILNSVRE